VEAVPEEKQEEKLEQEEEEEEEEEEQEWNIISSTTTTSSSSGSKSSTLPLSNTHTIHSYRYPVIHRRHRLQLVSDWVERFSAAKALHQRSIFHLWCMVYVSTLLVSCSIFHLCTSVRVNE
jgi:hypothetical protein